MEETLPDFETMYDLPDSFENVPLEDAGKETMNPNINEDDIVALYRHTPSNIVLQICHDDAGWFMTVMDRTEQQGLIDTVDMAKLDAALLAVTWGIHYSNK